MLSSLLNLILANMYVEWISTFYMFNICYVILPLDLVKDNLGMQAFFDLNIIPPAVFPFSSCLIVSLFSSTSAQRIPVGSFLLYGMRSTIAWI